MEQPVKKFVDIENFYSNELNFCLEFIKTEVRNYYAFNEITPEIFVFGALEQPDSMLYKSLNTYLNTETISEIHDFLTEKEKSKVITNIKKKVDVSANLKVYFVKCLDLMKKTKSNLINTDHVLLSILEEGNNTISEIFKEKGLTYETALGLSKNLHNVIEDVFDNIKNDKSLITNQKPIIKTFFVDGENLDDQEKLLKMLGLKGKSDKPQKNDGKIPFCQNLNKLAIENKFDDLIGREKEINEILRVLSRRKTNNVILVGNSGVGKTQIVNGFVKSLINGKLPLMFRGKEVWKFNPSEMIAGTTLRGMFEERMVNMIKSLKSNKNAILFIDDIHTIFSEKTKGDYDAGGIISELFNNGDIQVIATTTFKGYKTIIDNNGDIAKKLQRVNIDTPSIDDCINILINNKTYYEDFHNVYYSEDIIKHCVELSNRYITEKSLPSSAIDILDEVGAYKKLNNSIIKEISELDNENQLLKQQIDELVKKDDIDNVKLLEQKKENNRTKLSKLENKYKKLDKEEITLDDLYSTISSHTNIPIGKLNTNSKNELKNIDQKLKNVIIGQDSAIDIVSRSIKRNKVGLSKGTKPLFSGLFVGESGVGKTFLAKSLAKEIYGDEKYLVRFDMSEYSDKTSVNKLIGSAAGYVGYSEGGLLTEAVKNNKYCILLIDEIEKANEEIYNLLLQVLDEGFLTDNTGQKVDFKNTMIILTSNVGTKKANQTKPLGFNTDSTLNKYAIIEKELKDKFPPEFINRLDEIVYFNTLNDNNLKEIIKLELNKLQIRLNKINHSFIFDDNVIEFLFSKICNEKEYGARPISRAIQNEIENKITDLIIDNDFIQHQFKVEIKDNNLFVS